MCGEQSKRFLLPSLREGSPPRVRGTVQSRHIGHISHGITPACAGNRTADANARFLTKDHPRVCGEQFSQKQAYLPGRGSPPRVRGTAMFFFGADRHEGITPACAGNSPAFTAVSDPLKDHPRVCGEQSSPTLLTICVWGSPPRVRGTAEQNVVDERGSGITPACAGNSSSKGGGSTGAWDHPRVCGEQCREAKRQGR